MTLKNSNQPNKLLVYGYFAYHVAKSKDNSNLSQVFGFKGIHGSSTTCIYVGTAPYVSFDNSLGEVHLGSSANSFE